MVAKYQEYKASLKGVNSVEYYINKLQTYSGSKIIMENEEDCIRFQFIDPIKKIPDLSEIESDITKRARDLKWNAPDLVKETAMDINLAYQAEQKVNEGILSGLIRKCEENITAKITLTIMCEEDPLLMPICDHYACIRILEVAKVFDMALDGNVARL